MTGRVDSTELGRSVRAHLSSRLEDGGWSLLEPGGNGFRLAQLECRLTADFSGVALIDCAIPEPDGLAVVVNCVTVGVSYEPLRAWCPLLDGCLPRAALTSLRSAVLAYDVIRDLDEHGNERDETDENTEEEEGWQLPIATRSEASTVAGDLADLILERGVPCARRLADVDVLLAELEEEPGSFDWRTPVLLAAAGRLDDATDALSTFEALETSGQETPYTRQVRRLIESRGNTI